MKISYKSPDGRYLAEVTGEMPALLEDLSQMQELFHAASEECGICGSHRTIFRVRHPKTFTYYELYCLECRADLRLGERQKTHVLYPKRIDKDSKKPYPNQGWRQFRGTHGGDEDDE